MGLRGRRNHAELSTQLEHTGVAGTVNFRRVIIIIGLGLLIRVLLLALPGTADMHTNQVWGAWALEQGVTRAYVLDDKDYLDKFFRFLNRAPRPVSRIDRQTQLGVLDHVPDYPPLSIFQFWISAWLGRFLLGGELAPTPLLDAAFNVFPALFSLGIFLVALRWARNEGRPLSMFSILAFWLNPALILHSPVLGYVDAVFAFFGLTSLIALYRGKFSLSVCSLALACAIKPQGVLILPIVALGIWKEKNARLAWRQLGVFVLAALLPFVPFIFSGSFLAALRGTLLVVHVGHLSSHQANLWWILTWVEGAVSQGSWRALGAEVVMLPVEEFGRLGLLDVRVIAFFLWAGFMGFNLRWLGRELVRGNRRAIFWAGALQTYGFAMLSLYPKENHLYAFFVYALPLLTLERRRFAGIYAVLSLVFALNMFLFDGFGRGMAGYGETLRFSAGFDLTVLCSFISLGTFMWLVTREQWLYGLTHGTDLSPIEAASRP